MSKPAHLESVGEEIFSSITHGVGALAGAVLFVFLLRFSKGNLLKSVTFGVFGGLFFFLYLASTLCHSLSFTKAKKVFLIIDHCAIYLFIAGTYTPFALLVIQGTLGWIVFAAMWVLTILGVVYKSLFLDKFPKVSLAVYLIMGWCAILVAGPLVQGLSAVGLWLLVAGGLFYTFGAIFFSWEKLKFNHGIWHFFVLAGSLCHLFSLLTI